VVAYARRIAALAGVLAFLVIVSTGCGVIKSLITGGESSEVNDPAVQTDSGFAPENIDAGAGANDTELITNPFEVTLYFAGSDGNSLKPEIRVIEKSEGIARATMEELIAGPTPGNNLLPTIPQGTSLLDINVTGDGLCIVDFSSELLGEVSGEVIDDNLMVYSIVNTLTEFPTIERVEFRIEGEPVETLGANISASAPLYPDPSLIKQ